MHMYSTLWKVRRKVRESGYLLLVREDESALLQVFEDFGGELFVASLGFGVIGDHFLILGYQEVVHVLCVRHIFFDVCVLINSGYFN